MNWKFLSLLALLVTMANGRALLQGMPTNEAVRMGPTRNGTMVPLKNGYWTFDYTLNLLPTGPIQTYVKGQPTLDIQYGCGAGVVCP